MARPKRFTARVNLVMPQETYDAYREFADVADTTVQQLMRDMLAGSVDAVRRMTEAVREVKRDPIVGADVLLKHFHAVQAELGEVVEEAERVTGGERVHGEVERTKRKPA